ncbi:MAG: alpha/beta fold hydrolase, partial [Pseudomonadota bacterium]
MTVYDPATGEPINALNFGKGSFVDWVRWIDKDRMLLNAQSYAVAYGSVIAIRKMWLVWPREGKAEPLVENLKGFDAGELIHVAKDKQSVLIAHNPPDAIARGYRGWNRLFSNFEPGVYRYKLEPGSEPERVLRPKKGVDLWVTDSTGEVRLGLGWRRKKLSIYFRESGNAADEKGKMFERVARLKQGDTEGFFDALQIIEGSSRGYVLEENDEGRVGLRVFDYETREVVDTFWEHPDWDVERAWFGEDGEPVAAFYTDDKQRVEWFDEEYKAAYAELNEALPDTDTWIVARSQDGRRMLVSAGSEADPGVLYFYDADKALLKEFAQFRPKLDFAMMATPKPVSYTARDGTKIRAYLTLPKGRDPQDLPLIIHPHGGPYGVRDELRYDDQVQFLANRGYAVLQPNFRGSGGYGNEFYDLGYGEIGRRMQDDLDDAMDWAVAEGIADPERVCIVGASYGGYAALWGVLRNPERYACAASWAGVTDFPKQLKHDRRTLSRKGSRRWVARVRGDDEFDLETVSPTRVIEKLQRPVLLAHGTRDSTVPFDQYERMVKAAKKANVALETLVIEGAGHGFILARYEQEWYDALDRFLAE